MKILFFVSSFPRLSETFILNQMLGLIKEGHDITIIAKNKDSNNKVHGLITKYNLLNKVIYYGFDTGDNKFQKLIALIKSMLIYFLNKIIYQKYNYSGSLKDFINNPALLLLQNKLNNKRLCFDIIQAHFGPNGNLAQNLIDMGLLKGKLFTTFHGYDMIQYVNKMGEDVYKQLFQSNHKLLPISQFWKNKLIELGADSKNIIVHHMGVDVLKFEFNPLVPDQQIKILSVARFVEKKGLEYGIRAIAILIKQGYNIKYSIIGGGPLASKLQDIIYHEKLENHIEILGWRNQEEVIEIMMESHIVVQPSVSSDDGDMEGIPVLLMEAMAMGKLVVSTFHSGIPELIKNKRNGYLVKERDINGLADVILEIISSKDNWSQIAINARRTIMEEFNIEKLNKELLEIYKSEILKK